MKNISNFPNKNVESALDKWTKKWRHSENSSRRRY